MDLARIISDQVHSLDCEGIVLVTLLRNSLRLKDFDYLVILGRQDGDMQMVCCWKRRSISVPVPTTLPNTSPEGLAGSVAHGLDDENESMGGVLTAGIRRTADGGEEGRMSGQ